MLMMGVSCTLGTAVYCIMLKIMIALKFWSENEK
jgi:hypothetical protein